MASAPSLFMERGLHQVEPATSSSIRTMHANAMAHQDDSYRLRASRSLPSIDCSKLLKHVVFGSYPRLLRAFTTYTRRGRYVSGTAFALGNVLLWPFPFVDAATARWIAMAVCALQTPPAVISLLHLRYDLLVCIVHAYEFWFGTATLFTVVAANVVYFGDERCLYSVALSFVVFNLLLVDATSGTVKGTSVATAVGMLPFVVYFVYVTLDMMDGASSVVITKYASALTIETKDVIGSGMVTVFALAIRNIYRQRQSTVDIKMVKDGAIVRCISLRTRVAWEPVSTIVVLPTAPGINLPGRDVLAALPSKVTQLEAVQDTRLYRTKDVIVPTYGLSITASLARRFRLSLSTLGRISYLFTVASFILPFNSVPDRVISVVAFVTTALYLGVCATQCNKRMVRRLYQSFDFVFISIQVGLAHFTLCYLQGWNPRVYCILAQSAWVLFALSTDVFTPITKRKLGISTRLVGCAMFLEAFGLTVLAWELAFGGLRDLEDRDLTSIRLTVQGSDRVIHLSGRSFLLTRCITVFWWCWRFLWRMWKRSGDELIMIQATVQYRDVTFQRKQPRHGRRVGGLNWVSQRRRISTIGPASPVN